MKKLVSIIFAFLFLFSACKRQSSTEEITTESYAESSTSSFFENSATRYSDITENITNPTQSVTEEKQMDNITGSTSASYKENIQNSSPMIIFITLDELREVKKVYDSMTPDDFQEYMKNEHIDTYMTGMWDYENSTALLNEMCSTYVPVLDNNPDNLSELGFYWESNSIHQLVVFGGDKRASVIINTNKNTEPKNLEFDSNAVCLSQKNIEKDNFEAYIYEYQNTDYRFYADVFVDDTYIVFRSDWMDTLVEFEDCFNRLTFVKIGDLLNE